MKNVIFILISICLLLVAGCAPSPPLYKETQILMGTTVEVTIEAERERAGEISKKFFDRVRELEGVFSLYNEASEIVKVNKGAAEGGVKVSPDFFEVLEKSLMYSELSLGAFDITIAPLVKLWGFKDHKPAFPGEDAVKEARERCGYTYIKILPGESKVGFSRPGMAIDLNAIAKGYIAGKGAEFLKKEGVDRALVNAGGQIYCIGAPSGKDGWVVAIRHPRKKGRVATQITLRDMAVATSGDYENYFLYEGKYLSHIIDPRTGWPAESGVVSATVISPDSAEADALATALVVMARKDGIDLVNHLDNAEAIIIYIEKGELGAVTSSGLEGKLKFDL